MKQREFKARPSFIQDLKALLRKDDSLHDEVFSAIEILLEEGRLPAAHQDHPLERQWTGYREFHLRDNPNGTSPSDINDVLVIYKWDKNRLVAIGVRIGSHEKLFFGKYRKEG